MIVYHGSYLAVEKPEVRFSKDYLDFGRGFYVTTFQAQAEKWAMRKSLRKKASPMVSIYTLPDSLAPYRVLSFDAETERWLDFVCQCRRGSDCNQEYDFIIGNVADDDVFKTVDMYFRGIWTKDRALEELRYCRQNDQICIVSQRALEETLIFQKTYCVERRHDE